MRLLNKLTALLIPVFILFFIPTNKLFAQEGEQCEVQQICTVNGKQGTQTCLGKLRGEICDLSQNPGACFVCSSAEVPTPQPINTSPYPTTTSSLPPSASTPVPSGTTSSSGKVTAPSLQNDEAILRVANQALLPSELFETPTPNPNANLTPTPTPKPAQIGVNKGIFNLICQIIGLFCPQLLEISNVGITKFIDKGDIFINTERPEGLQPTPAKKDTERLKDTTETEGDAKLDKLNTVLGTDQGVYSLGLPEFAELNPESPQNIFQTMGQTLGKLLFKGQPLDQDYRVPDIEVRKQIFDQTHFPEGIRPFEPTPTPRT